MQTNDSNDMNDLIKQIDNLLPQTQCGQCSYPGCLPYAEAIAINKESINRCPPGGITVLRKLAELTKQDAAIYLADIQKQEQSKVLAKIRETECIGCTKCIQACPVDAIVGAAKQLHTVLTEECTGCGLCVTPCPVDCIDLVNVKNLHYLPEKARQRFNARKLRTTKNKTDAIEKFTTNLTQDIVKEENNSKKDYIQAAIARAKQKKLGTSYKQP